MRAVVIPGPKGRWEIREVPRPEPAANQVLIKVHASGICYTDVHLTEGALPVPFPAILGHEPVGEIVALGAGVATRRLGDRVGVPWVQATCGRCSWCLSNRPNFCRSSIGTGVGLPGGHAEYMVAFADATMLLPDALSYEQAAPLFCAGYTVWSGLRLAEPQPGERVAVVGIGGLGHLAVQYAHAAGFETLAVTRSADKVQLVRDLGADHVVADGEALKKAGGADVVLACSNSNAATSDALRGLRPDGRLIVMGFDTQPLAIPSDILLARWRIIGSHQNDRRHLHECLDMAARGKVKVLTETYALADCAHAYEQVEHGRARFRAVLKP